MSEAIEAPKKKRLDFCMRDCSCQKQFGEVVCCKVLPEVIAWWGTHISTMDNGILIAALNKLWQETHP